MDSTVPNTGSTVWLVGEHSNAVRLSRRATLCFNIASRPNSWDAPGEDGVRDKFNSKKLFTRLIVRSRPAAEGVEWWYEDTQVESNEVTTDRAKSGHKAKVRTLKRATKRCRGGDHWVIFVSAAVRVFWISRPFLF